jgi:hypothetical protein
MQFLKEILCIMLFCSMVFCGAQGCSWEKATDNRGLDRHRVSCSFFRRSSVLATQKQLEHARNATAANCVANMSMNISQVSRLVSDELELQSFNLSIEDLTTEAFQ